MGFWNKVKKTATKAWNASNSPKAKKYWNSFKKSANKWADTPDGRATLMKMRVLTGGLSDDIIQKGSGFIDDVVNRPDNVGFNQFVADEVGKNTPLKASEVKFALDKARPLGRQIDKGIGNLEKEINKKGKKRGVRRKS